MFLYVDRASCVGEGSLEFYSCWVVN